MFKSKDEVRTLKGRVTVSVREGDNTQVIQRTNTIVDKFEKACVRSLAHLVSDASDFLPSRFDVGTSDQPTTTDMNSLVAGLSLNLSLPTITTVVFPNSPDETSVKWIIVLPISAAVGQVLMEAGIFNLHGDMLARVTHIPVTKSNIMEVQYDWEWYF